jgi:mannose-6-phosphate isomerase
MEHQLNAFEKGKAILSELNLNIVDQNTSKPWGGFYVIDEQQADAFAKHFFPDEDFEALKITEKLSPKLLMVAPNKRLSWQYHHRRAEIWRCIDGTVSVATSLTDEEENLFTLHTGDKIKLQQGERHRLIGLDDWGIIAEIWQHTDINNPSNEEDIVRVQDDFGR